MADEDQPTETGEQSRNELAMAHLSPKERELYAAVFLSMDKDGNGWLSIKELTEGCRRLGHYIADEHAEAAFNAIDTNDDGRVTLDEFLAIMGHIEQEDPRAKKEAKLRRKFREMDTDEDGRLTEKELLEGLRDLGYNLSRDQAKRLCSDLDANHDGKIDFEEFIKMFKLD